MLALPDKAPEKVGAVTVLDIVAVPVTLMPVLLTAKTSVPAPAVAEPYLNEAI